MASWIWVSDVKLDVFAGQLQSMIILVLFWFYSGTLLGQSKKKNSPWYDPLEMKFVLITCFGANSTSGPEGKP